MFLCVNCTKDYATHKSAKIQVVPRWTKWFLAGGQLEWTLHFWRFLNFSFTIESVATPQGPPLLSTHSMRPEINQKLNYSIQCGFAGFVTYHITNLNIQVNQSQKEKLKNYFAIKEQISQCRIRLEICRDRFQLCKGRCQKRFSGFCPLRG